jgi:hypothetical protein
MVEMGLVLKARAALKKKGLFSSSRISLDDLIRALLAEAKGTPLQEHAQAWSQGPRGPVEIKLYPNGGHIAIRSNGDHVEVEAKTDAVGPGYHAYLVSVLDSMQPSLGLKWEWFDPTDYARKRDFTDLESRMAQRFRESCADLVRQVKDSPRKVAGAKIFMPDDFSVVAAEGEIFTPFGPITYSRLEHWASLDGCALREAAANFALWWDEGFGGSFHRGLVLYALWLDIRWATPLDKEEADTIIRVLDGYANALEHRADLPIPQAAINELFALVEGELWRPIADPQGIGYCRRDWIRWVGQNWRLVMPGCLEEIEEEDDSSTYVFTTDRLDVRASVYIAPSDDPEIRAGVYDGEISVIDKHVEKLDRTFTVRNLAKTYPLGERTSVCCMTITSSTPETRVIGERIGQSLTYVP